MRKGSVTNASRHYLAAGLALYAGVALAILSRVAAAQVPEPIAPLPLTIAVNSARASIGERLFHDVRLARDNAHSCATCHPLAQGGAQPRPRASACERYRAPTRHPDDLQRRFQFFPQLGWRHQHAGSSRRSGTA